MIILQNNEVLIRDMEEPDILLICQAEGDQSESSIRYYEKQFGHIREKMCAGLVAVCEGEIAGYVYLYYRCKWGGLGNQGYPGVVDLTVMEKFRRRGIGSMLMDAAEQLAAAYSDRVYLDVGLNSEFGRAQRLYAKRGYIPDGKGCYYEEKVCGTDAWCRNSDELTLCLVKKLEKKIQLCAPKEARTSSSIALLWDKPSCEVSRYEIYVNGEKSAETDSTDETITDLEAGKQYEFQIFAIVADGKERIAESEKVQAATKQAGRIYRITDYGAVGDGKQSNTKAIQRAIADCEEGGTVYVPKGRFLTGAVFLKSDMTLYIEKGGVLLGSDDIMEYPVFSYRYEGREQQAYASLINMPREVPDGWRPDDERYEIGEERIRNMCHWKNVTICGGGLIDANGKALFSKEMEEKAGARGRAVCIRNTDGVYLYDITIRNAPAWCLHPIYCRNVSINRVKIYNKYDESGVPYSLPNADGIDPDSCAGVRIFHSFIESEDDCIAMKSGNNQEGRRVGIPTRDVRISNCSFSQGFGVAMGSEMAGGIFDVLVQDCVFRDSYSLASVKNQRGRGSSIERITYENIDFVNHSTEHHDCKWFRGAIYVDQFYAVEEVDTETPEAVTEGTPAIRDIVFRNISLETVAGNAIYLCGLPERHLEGIVLKNVTARGRYGMKVYNADDLVQENVTVETMTEY